MDDQWTDASEEVHRVRGTFPVGREAAKRAGRKKTRRSKRIARRIGQGTMGIRNRRIKRG